MSSELDRVRALRHILVRVGARQASRYWSNPFAVLFSNFVGGTIAGAAALIFAALIVGIDLHRGENSVMVHLLRAVQTVAGLVRNLMERELR